jgi:hypothetical protein
MIITLVRFGRSVALCRLRDFGRLGRCRTEMTSPLDFSTPIYWWYAVGFNIYLQSFKTYYTFSFWPLTLAYYMLFRFPTRAVKLITSAAEYTYSGVAT